MGNQELVRGCEENAGHCRQTRCGRSRELDLARIRRNSGAGRSTGRLDARNLDACPHMSGFKHNFSNFALLGHTLCGWFDRPMTLLVAGLSKPCWVSILPLSCWPVQQASV